ncbi:hypothetical protein N7222_26800, partial [Klebsiella pneumoniae]|nr:hypothetical protein [Klebsiella pneumoniae]MCT9956009.1 hypothetical protein [Klebsiella pneumoniae]MCU0151036.1 hypothetical protein [Klebsiella pneumoniae]MCU0168316.1 hypothetical protein [Klebsiella pneumoniae]MCU6598685.1 hypothetical protein [Klebsiella pneumoniae]
NSLNRLIRCVCGKKIGPDPRNFNQRVSLGRNDLLIRTFPNRSLAEQDRIIAILDKFEILTNSISEGLPREINLRQKQYEYYRDLLLSFPKSNV